MENTVILSSFSFLLPLLHTVYVDLPNVQARLEILQTHARRVRLAPTVMLDKITTDRRCEGFSGADLAALIREAGTAALRRLLDGERLGIGQVCLRGSGFEVWFWVRTSAAFNFTLSGGFCTGHYRG